MLPEIGGGGAFNVIFNKISILYINLFLVFLFLFNLRLFLSISH